jgi:hypothetical protein
MVYSLKEHREVHFDLMRPMWIVGKLGKHCIAEVCRHHFCSSIEDESEKDIEAHRRR